VVVCGLNGFVWLNVDQGCTNTGRQVAVATKSFRWFLISVDPQYGTGVVWPYWLLEFLDGSQIFGKFVQPWDGNQSRRFINTNEPLDFIKWG